MTGINSEESAAKHWKILGNRSNKDPSGDHPRSWKGENGDGVGDTLSTYIITDITRMTNGKCGNNQ